MGAREEEHVLPDGCLMEMGWRNWLCGLGEERLVGAGAAAADRSREKRGTYSPQGTYSGRTYSGRTYSGSSGQLVTWW